MSASLFGGVWAGSPTGALASVLLHGNQSMPLPTTVVLSPPALASLCNEIREQHGVVRPAITPATQAELVLEARKASLSQASILLQSLSLTDLMGMPDGNSRWMQHCPGIAGAISLRGQRPSRATAVSSARQARNLGVYSC